MIQVLIATRERGLLEHMTERQHDYIPLAIGTEEGVDGGGTRGGGDENTPPAKMEEVRERPFLQGKTRTNPLKSLSTYFSPFRSSSTLARVGSKNSPAS